MKPKQYLTLRGDIWYLNYRIPKSLASHIGKQNLMYSLGTDSLSVAQRLRNQAIVEIKANEASLGVNPDGVRLRSLVSKIKREYSKLNTNEEYLAFDSYYDAESEANNGDKILASAILLATDDSRTEALGLSEEYTLQEVGTLYLAGLPSDVGSTTISSTKRALRYFKDNLKGRDTSINSINRPAVLKFIEFLEQELGRKSINSLLSCLTQVWRYALDREYVTAESPFIGHRLNIARVKPNSKKPFSVAQWAVLLPELNGNANTYGKKWFTAIGLLTGMRINELAGLYKDDVQQDSDGRYFFEVHEEGRRLKNESAVRIVPIHNSILNAVLKLKSESSNEFLFQEVATSPSNRSGSMARWFTVNKKKYVSEDKSISFHSLRVMLATAFENAQIEEGIASTILGHKKHTMTYGLYSKGVRLELLTKALDKAVNELQGYTAYFPEESGS